MGLELVVAGAASTSLGAIVDRVAAAGIPCVVAMVDGALMAPGRPLPVAWRDVRLRAPEGTLTLLRRGDDLAVVVFGNADDALRGLQERVVKALQLTP